jgi:hypothetical protein
MARWTQHNLKECAAICLASLAGNVKPITAFATDLFYPDGWTTAIHFEFLNFKSRFEAAMKSPTASEFSH